MSASSLVWEHKHKCMFQYSKIKILGIDDKLISVIVPKTFLSVLSVFRWW